MDKYTLLRERFGCNSFRDGQAELIDAIMAGRDVFGIMPTGGARPGFTAGNGSGAFTI